MDEKYAIDLSKYQLPKNYHGRHPYEIKEKATGLSFLAWPKISLFYDNSEITEKEEREIEFFKNINHPTILRFIGYSPVYIKGNQDFTIITEYSSDFSILKECPEQLTPTKIHIIIYGIATAILYAHKHDFLLLNFQSSLVFIDANFYPKVMLFSPCGYIMRNTSMQVYLKFYLDTDDHRSKASDVYSFGFFLYQLLAYEIFNKKPVLPKPQQIMQGFRPKIPSTVPDYYKSLIESCWAPSPEGRPTFDSIVKELKEIPEFITESIDKDKFLEYVNYIDNYPSSYGGKICDKNIEIAYLNSQISLLKKEHNENEKYKKEIADKDKEISQLKDQISRFEKQQQLKEEEEAKQESDLLILDNEQIKELKLVQTLGRGAQSEVFLVTRNENLVLKVLHVFKASSEQDEREMQKNLKLLLQEHEILRLLKHKNILRTFGFSYGDLKHAPSILLEYCPKTLSQAAPKMSSIEKICAIYEICQGMEAVHEAKIIHRDLKPENIMIDDFGHIKIGDFGISCFVDVETQTKTGGIGTLLFMAPELLNGSIKYGYKVDVFSFGVVMYFVLMGKLPKLNVADRVNRKKIDIPSNINKVSRNLMNKCWEFDAKDRPSFTKIIEIIKSNNFKLIDGIDDELTDIKSFLSL